MVSGSRSLKLEIPWVRNALNDLRNFVGFNKISKLIHGGAIGIDTYANEFCKDFTKVEIFNPDYSKGKSAPFQRNIEMLKLCDVVFVIWDGKSKGTLHVINNAVKLNKDLIIKTKSWRQLNE